MAGKTKDRTPYDDLNMAVVKSDSGVCGTCGDRMVSEMEKEWLEQQRLPVATSQLFRMIEISIDILERAGVEVTRIRLVPREMNEMADNLAKSVLLSELKDIQALISLKSRLASAHPFYQCSWIFSEV